MQWPSNSLRRAQAATLIFDGDCAFCSSSARVLERMPLRLPRIEPYQFADLAALGISHDRAEREIVLVDTTGAFGGADAIARMLQAQPRAVWRLGGRVLSLPGVIHTARALYRVIATNRDRLPGGTPECALPQAVRDARRAA